MARRYFVYREGKVVEVNKEDIDRPTKVQMSTDKVRNLDSWADVAPNIRHGVATRAWNCHVVED